MNVQTLTDPFGRLLRASPALPGSTHDLTAARQRGIIDALADAGLTCRADKALFCGTTRRPGASTWPTAPSPNACSMELSGRTEAASASRGEEQ